jgi:hypothetical protein
VYYTGNMARFGGSKDGVSGRVLCGNHWSAVLCIETESRKKKVLRLERTNLQTEEDKEACASLCYHMLDDSKGATDSEKSCLMNWTLFFHQYIGDKPTGVMQVGMRATRKCRASIITTEIFRIRSKFCYQPFR